MFSVPANGFYIVHFSPKEIQKKMMKGYKICGLEKNGGFGFVLFLEKSSNPVKR
jgi:hypothetical protein